MSGLLSDFSEDQPQDWVDLLPLGPLLDCLKDEGIEPVQNGNLMCETRGDLFVWSAAKSAVLTTNLKRLKAHPSEEQTFQMLVCTASPLTAVTHLLPDELGGHIALLSRQAVSVMTLPRSRGEHGEFGGGQLSVNCRVTPVATDLFTIHSHTLHLLQAHWHPSHPHTLILLTSDSTLRVFSMADPNYPRSTIPLTPSAAAQVHSCNLEDTIVSFACTRDNKIFALRDTGDVMVTHLAPPTCPAPSDPLPMHPMSEDNYGTDEATALLVLETTPPVLIIAHSSDGGTVYHSVYMEGEKEGGNEEEREGGHSINDGSLYVVERVKLELQEDDEFLSLTKDPVLPYRYFISHREGMQMVTIPWVNRMNQFTTSSSMEELVMRADSDVHSLVQVEDPTVSSIQGAAIISEPLLGPSAVFLTSDLQCQVLSLQAPPPAQYVTDIGPMTTRPHPQVKSDAGGFVKVVRDILGELSDPPQLVAGKKKDMTQQELFDFFQCSVQCLRAKYLLPQQKANAALQRRLDILDRQKEQQLRDLVAICDKRAEVLEKDEDIRWKAKEMEQQSSLLLRRLEQLLCKLDAQSPILSNAEMLMEQELTQLSGKLTTTRGHIQEAKGKLKLGYGVADRGGSVSISKSQDESICSILNDAGKRLLALKLQIKGLVGAMPT